MFKNISNEQILLLAQNSTSITDVCIKLGYSDSKSHAKIKQILVELEFNLSKFKGRNISHLNDKEKLEKIVKESFSYSEVLTKFKLSHHTETLKSYLKLFSISVEHFNRNKYTNYNRVKVPLTVRKEDFSVNSKKTNKYIKKVILENNLISYICASKGCENQGEWLGKSITLQLEHKNGIRNDHRLENMEFLCPNCHTQTKTYCSKNSTLLKRLNKLDESVPRNTSMNLVYIYFIYENKIDILLEKISSFKSYTELLTHFNFVVSSKNTKYIKDILQIYKNNAQVRMFNKNRILKNRDGIKFPPPQELLKMVKNSNYSAVGRELNCSDNAIRFYLKREGFL